MDSDRPRIGLRRRTTTAALAAALIAATPSLQAQDDVDARLAEEARVLLNAARARTTDCGNAAGGPPGGPTAAERAAAPDRPALRWNALLADAARRHATGLAHDGRLDHVAADGTTVRERVTATGYRWRSLAENLAAGHPDLRAAVDAWLESAPHCAALLDARFSEFGVARAVADRSSELPGRYWILVLGHPR